MTRISTDFEHWPPHAAIALRDPQATEAFSAKRWTKLPFGDQDIQADTKVSKITLKE